MCTTENYFVINSINDNSNNKFNERCSGVTSTYNVQWNSCCSTNAAFYTGYILSRGDGAVPPACPISHIRGITCSRDATWRTWPWTCRSQPIHLLRPRLSECWPLQMNSNSFLNSTQVLLHKTTACCPTTALVTTAAHLNLIQMFDHQSASYCHFFRLRALISVFRLHIILTTKIVIM